MAVCKFEGNSDMYGLGIRLGYYLQWFGGILAAWLAPTEVKGLRFTLELFVAATFLALIIHTANDVDSLQHVETYIVLLLAFGIYLALIPIYLWRLLTCCDPYWDPTRWPKVDPGRLTANLSFILLVGVLVYQYWFWFAHMPSLDDINCQQYGFLFGQVRLNSKVSVAVNALAYCFLGLIVLYVLALKFLGSDALDGRRPTKISRSHRHLLQNMEGWFKIIVGLTIVLATELTIQWNEIEGVNSLVGAGQTIPFVIGIAAIVRIFYVYYVYPENNPRDNISGSGSVHSRPGSRPGSRPDGPISMKQVPYGRMPVPQNRRGSRSRPASVGREIPGRPKPARVDRSDRSRYSESLSEEYIGLEHSRHGV